MDDVDALVFDRVRIATRNNKHFSNSCESDWWNLQLTGQIELELELEEDPDSGNAALGESHVTTLINEWKTVYD